MQTDSHNFDLHEQGDAARPTRSKGIGVALLTALAVVLALIAIDVLAISGAQAAPARPVVNVVKVSGATPIQHTIYLSVSPGIKPAVDGKLHDAFSVTNFTVRAGQPVKLVIDNTDTSDHSITAMGGRREHRRATGAPHVHAARSQAGQVHVDVHLPLRPVLDEPHRLHARLHHRGLRADRHQLTTKGPGNGTLRARDNFVGPFVGPDNQSTAAGIEPATRARLRVTRRQCSASGSGRARSACRSGSGGGGREARE